MRGWKRSLRVAGVALLLVGGLLGCGGDEQSDAVRLRLVLDYLPNPLHAGIYLGQAEGRFEAAGLDLVVTAPTSTTDTLRLVAAGQADVGLVPLMDFFQAVENGQDLQLVMALVDRPLAAVLVRAKTGVTRPRELQGRLVGLTGVPSDQLTLDAMVRFDGGDPEAVESVVIGFNGAQNLVAGSVTAAFGFWSYEGVLAGQSVPLRELRPTDYGIPNYPEIVAFTRRDVADARPEALAAFRETMADAYAAALAMRPVEALAPLASVLEGERAEDLVPFWEVLLPVLPGSQDFRGELSPAELQTYLDWVVGQSFLSTSRRVEPLVFNPPR